ncbi:MAG TPA: hypothetical protein VGR24_11525 [bacterium]|nr:hypothetical protein [bacterium]
MSLGVEPNLLMTAMRIVFDGSPTATAFITLADSATPRRWPVGFEGEKVIVSAHETAHELGATIKGRRRR